MSAYDDIKTKALALVAEIDEQEMTIRIIEAMGQIKRPAGVDAAELLARSDPETVRMSRRAAKAAMAYVAECLNDAERVQ